MGQSSSGTGQSAGRRNRSVLILSAVSIVAVGIVGTLAMFIGSQPSEESQPTPAPVATTPTKAVPIVQSIEKQQAPEGDEIRITPKVTNSASFERGLRFSAVSELPTGCVLNETTGELAWTPTELQGPKDYNLTLRVADAAPGGSSCEFPVVITVAEINQPPIFDPTLSHSIEAGEVLLISLSAKDDDFPPNDITFHLEPGPASGAVIDVKTQTLRWKVPEDHDNKMVPIVLRATDSGSPNKSVLATLSVQVTATKPVAAVEVSAVNTSPGETGQNVAFQVGLPSPLPRELKEVAPVDLAETLPALKGSLSKLKSWRAALIIPKTLQGRVKTRHTDESFSTFLVDLLGAARTDKQRTEQLDGAIAKCTVSEGKIEWTWESSKSSSVRGLQNNLRDCLLEVVSDDGKTKLLIGLTEPVKVVFGLDRLFKMDDLQFRATRLDRRAQVFPLLSTDLSLDYGSKQAKLTPVDPKGEKNTTARFESADLAKFLGVQRVGLIIRSRNNEYVVGLVSEPSLLNRKKTALASRKILLSLVSNQKKWNRKLSQAKRDLARARAIPQNTKTNRDARASGIRQATARGNQSIAKLNGIASQLPVAKRTMDNTQKQLDDLQGRFTAIQNARLSGQMYANVANSRVLRMSFVGQLDVSPMSNSKDLKK
jgi:hypothetical protein